MTAAFKLWSEPYDPNGESKAYAFQLKLPPGATILPTPVVDIVDARGVVLASDLSATSVAYGLVPEVTLVNLWRVYWRPVGGSLPTDITVRKEYLVRCQYTLSTSPINDVKNRTVRLWVHPE